MLCIQVEHTELWSQGDCLKVNWRLHLNNFASSCFRRCMCTGQRATCSCVRCCSALGCVDAQLTCSLGSDHNQRRRGEFTRLRRACKAFWPYLSSRSLAAILEDEEGGGRTRRTKARPHSYYIEPKVCVLNYCSCPMPRFTNNSQYPKIWPVSYLSK